MTEASGLTDDQARIGHAAESIRGMTRDMLDEQSGSHNQLADLLRRVAVEAPLRSLALAFLLGLWIGRR